MVTVGMMNVSIVKVVNVVSMPHRGVSAVGAMNVRVVAVIVASHC